MEQSDLDYALSLHYLLNGETLNDIMAQTVKDEGSDEDEVDSHQHKILVNYFN
jgi:hypothetical protein